MRSQEQTNFSHLVFDIAWFGLALAATTRFLSIYAMRLGASPTDLGWIASLPGLVLLIAAGLTPRWRRLYSSSLRAVIWPALTFRIIFLLPAFAPFLPVEWRPLWLILAVTIPALPQGIAGAIFISLMRESVNEDRQAALHSHRSMAMNITIGLGALAFGVLLEALPFPLNYQVMFVLAFLFALASFAHVLRIHILYPAPVPLPRKQAPQYEEGIWRSPAFLSVALAALIGHVAFTALVMVIPLHLVDGLGASEGFMALYGMVELGGGALMAVFAEKLIHRFGSRQIIAMMMVGLAAAAVWMALVPVLALTLVTALLTGMSWTAATISMFVYLVERVPSRESTRSSGAFQQVIALGVFLGPLFGNMLLDLQMPVVNVLLTGAVLRILIGIVIYYNPLEVTAPPRLSYALKGRRRRR